MTLTGKHITTVCQLTVVLLGKEGPRCRGEKLPQILDFSHNVNST